MKLSELKNLIKEILVTGGTASVTSGTGEGVATKYAFGKTNKWKFKKNDK